MTSSDAGTLGGARPEFPSTCWSRLQAGRWDGAGGSPEALEELGRNYWKPIYAYIRTKWSKPHADALDIAQDFFLWMMESDFVSKADPAAGRFRAFVQVALKHYLINDDRARRRQKRGGEKPVFALGEVPEGRLPDPGGRPPDRILDDEWRQELLLRATRRLEEELRAEGKELAFRVFREYHLSGRDAALRQEDVSARLGLSPVEVKNHLARTKERFRAVLSGLVAETVASPEDLREELDFLFGAP